ncbi:adenosine deaminase [Candidatus Peregrinibacteria bacterium]|nr:adenosine deaminase [Candidatus Peregrinibacteria bacterium]
MVTKEFCYNLPKAELHLHIEGTFEPELIFTIAQKNNVTLKYKSVEEIRKAYNFSNLQDFLDIYYQGMSVLIHEQDFFDLTWAYLQKAHEQGVKHAEIFFDPQGHTARGVSFEKVITGISGALEKGQKELGISYKLIMCFLRHLSEQDALKTWEEAKPYLKNIHGVGLDSSEVGNPPSKFSNVYTKAREAGLFCVAHAGEEGPASYIYEALDILKVVRIDHGNHSLDDQQLVDRLVKEKMPLTVCPLSNLKLKVVEDLSKHPLKKMMDAGLLVTLNSDDPAYFGGYIGDNYFEIAKTLNLSEDDLKLLAKNSINATQLDQSSKNQLLEKIA